MEKDDTTPGIERAAQPPTLRVWTTPVIQDAPVSATMVKSAANVESGAYNKLGS